MEGRDGWAGEDVSMRQDGVVSVNRCRTKNIVFHSVAIIVSTYVQSTTSAHRISADKVIRVLINYVEQPTLYPLIFLLHVRSLSIRRCSFAVRSLCAFVVRSLFPISHSTTR